MQVFFTMTPSTLFTCRRSASNDPIYVKSAEKLFDSNASPTRRTWNKCWQMMSTLREVDR
jgi:hypothetical protein